MEDKEIVERYISRNEKALQMTSEKYGALCHKIALNIIGNEEDAKECVNDAYLAVWNRIPPENPRSLMAFLSKIVRNISLDRLDYNRAACRNSNATVVLDEVSDFLPDQTKDSSDLKDAIHLFLTKQTKSARCVFVRRYFYCDSIAEIALRYGMTESAVKSLLHRVRRRLAEFLKKGGFYDEI